VNNNLLEKSGSWFSYKGERIGQGRENARQFLKDNKDTMAKLEAEVRKTLGLVPANAVPVPVPGNGAPAAAAPGQQQAKVATMPTATSEPAKVPAARR
jgi:recombination protein RecA